MILLAKYLGGLTPHVPAIASLPGSGLVTQIWRLCLLRLPEAEPPVTAFPGGTWERATWGVKPPNRFANRIINFRAGYEADARSEFSRAKNEPQKTHEPR